ncbi:hypothetical protein J6590_024278 [Homalodisca vitripennis]|nr:hypothetical protein J6590_024278 [Homalodisca vitripennis]
MNRGSPEGAKGEVSDRRQSNQRDFSCIITNNIFKLNLTDEELKYLDEIEENQEHNIGNILAVQNLSESPRPPATLSISLDEIGESQEHNISNILAVPDLSESPRPPATPRRQVLGSKVKTSLASRVYK